MASGQANGGVGDGTIPFLELHDPLGPNQVIFLTHHLWETTFGAMV